MKRIIANFAKVPANVCRENDFLGAGAQFLRSATIGGNNSIFFVRDKYCEVEVHRKSI